jgi:hypothetical protein
MTNQIAEKIESTIVEAEDPEVVYSNAQSAEVYHYIRYVDRGKPMSIPHPSDESKGIRHACGQGHFSPFDTTLTTIEKASEDRRLCWYCSNLPKSEKPDHVS